jgi:hypothetical protein
MFIASPPGSVIVALPAVPVHVPEYGTEMSLNEPGLMVQVPSLLV